MTRRLPRSRRLVCIATLALTVLATSAAQAEITGATVVINTPGGAGTVQSASVTTMSIVTNPAYNKGVSYIEIFGVTSPAGSFGLRIISKDQRRIEAFYDQILKATALRQEFQITVYATGTFQTDGYVGDLDIGWNYFILH